MDENTTTPMTKIVVCGAKDKPIICEAMGDRINHIRWFKDHDFNPTNVIELHVQNIKVLVGIE